MTIVFIILIVLCIVEVFFHIFGISIPFFSVGFTFYNRFKDDNTIMSCYHKRHLISCIVVTPLVSVEVLTNALIHVKVVCLIIVLTTVSIVGKRDRDIMLS